MSTFIISCGGTGGHLSPGIALAQELIERGHSCYLMISKKDVDARLIRAYPHFEFIRMPGIPFSLKPWRFFKFLYFQFRNLITSLHLVYSKKPDAIIGFGAFLTPGIIFAGALKGCPRTLHEANRVPGKAVRFLSMFASRVYLPEGIHLKSFPPQAIRHYGFPIRKEIKKIAREQARKKLNMPHGKLLLVLGGSQGALVLNDWVLHHFEALGKSGISVYCITGLKMGAHGTYEHKNESGELTKAMFVPFVDSMSYVLSAADLVIGRAGAGSIAEFVHTRLPSILVPFPYSSDNHQKENAAYMERCGGALLVDQSKMDTLMQEVQDTIFNDYLIQKMQNSLAAMDRFNSAKMIADDMELLCQKKSS